VRSNSRPLLGRGAGGRSPGFLPTGRRSTRYHVGPDAPVDTTELITTYVRQIEVRRTEIVISLLGEDQVSEDKKGKPLVLTVHERVSAAHRG
jgi:hypothetical protein